MESDAPAELVLRDTVEVHTDEYGSPVDDMSDTLRDESHRIVRELRKTLGEPQLQSAEISRSGRGTRFGGLDVITEARELVFAFGGAGATAGMFGLAREWMRLKSRRRVLLKVKRPDGTELELDVTGLSPEQARTLVLEVGGGELPG